MSNGELNRRDFQKLTAAALGGLAAGTVLGCSTKPDAESSSAELRTPADVHLCRGLNDCKGQGKGNENSCRGQGDCATASEHKCGGMNECKGLGGCGDTVGANDCKGKGGCQVPLMQGAWEKLRTKKTAEWTAKNDKFGEPPPKAPAKSS